MKFRDLKLVGRDNRIPSDIELKVPDHAEVDNRDLHFLIYIPWDDRYLNDVPGEYKAFFEAVRPQLAVRTTDVHVALCLPFVKKLGDQMPENFDWRVAYIALILHDIGWSRLSDQEVAASLGVKGLALTAGATGPKEKHANVGKAMAKDILERYQFNKPLTDKQKDLICDAIQYHDKPGELAKGGNGIPLEVRLVCDVDHLWSFTHENFWQDTVRKDVEPAEYVKNLANDLDGYFITQQAKDLAQYMLSQRKAEVEKL